MKQVNFQAVLPVSILREGDRFIAYSPALDISTSGKTHKEVSNRFSELASIFLEEIIKKGTLEEVLRESGWKKIKFQLIFS